MRILQNDGIRCRGKVCKRAVGAGGVQRCSRNVVSIGLLDRESVWAAADPTIEYFGRIVVMLDKAIHLGHGSIQPLVEVEESEMLRMFVGNVPGPLGVCAAKRELQSNRPSCDGLAV